MPDLELDLEMQEDMPKFNMDIVNGLACKGLVNAKDLVDQRIRCAEKSYPEGFEFIGSYYCTTMETAKVMATAMTRGDRSVPTIDLAETDAYLVKYIFAFNGKHLYPRYLYLPSPKRGGLIKILSKQFSISPVAADPCFSIGQDNVFFRTNRSPITFRYATGTVTQDRDHTAEHPHLTGEQVSTDLAYTWVHNRGGANNKTGKSDTIALGRAVTSLPHYLFAKYGMLETFKRFGRCDVTITTLDEIRKNPPDLKKYALFESDGTKPATLKLRTPYSLIRSPIALLIPRAQLTPLVRTFVAGFYYVVDHYPERTDIEELGGSWLWLLWLGYFLAGDQLGPIKLVENMETHLSNLDDYIDMEAQRVLFEEEALVIEDIYELFVYVLQHMDRMLEEGSRDIGSMYGKRLVTAPYVLRDIFEQIFLCLFEIINNRKRKHGPDDFNKILGKHFMPTKIFDLRKTSIKPFISSVSTPGDNLIPKICSRLVMQSQTSGQRKPQNINVNDPQSHLHASAMETGNHTLLPKNGPLAKNTANMTMQLDANFTIEPKESMKAVVAHVDKAIGRH